MRRPRRCHNCGSWYTPVYSGQAVCCVDWDGPRWIDDPQAVEDYKHYREWYERLPEEKAR